MDIIGITIYFLFLIKLIFDRNLFNTYDINKFMFIKIDIKRVFCLI